MTQESRTSRHTPVLSQDVIRYLDVSEGGTYLDCTIGLAGHASQIASLLGPNGHLIGLDRDPKALELEGQRLQALAEKTLSAYEFWRKTLASFVRENYAALGVHFFSHGSFWRAPERRVAA